MRAGHSPPYPWPEPIRKAQALDRLVAMYQQQGRPESHIIRMLRVLNPPLVYQEDF